MCCCCLIWRSGGRVSCGILDCVMLLRGEVICVCCGMGWSLFDMCCGRSGFLRVWGMLCDVKTCRWCAGSKSSASGRRN